MNQSVLKAIKLLDCFTNKKELSIIELSELTEIPKTTVFRIVSSLENGGFLVKIRKTSHDVKYHLGFKLFELGNTVIDQIEYRKIAISHMEKLNKELNELVHMVGLEADSGVYIHTVDSTKPVRLVVKVGGRSPLYAGSAPKLLLAYMKESEREEYFKDLKLEKLTQNTIINIDELRKEIKKIKVEGFSVSHGEHYAETVGFSYPIFDYSKKVVAALGISIAEADYSKENEKEILKKLEITVRDISKELGYNKNE